MEKEEKISFEDAVQRLEQIVRQLETGNAPLDKSLELYEEGISLVNKCTKELKNAEKKIKILTSENGNLNEKDFE